MLTYYAYYTPHSITINAISTNVGVYDAYVKVVLHRLRQTLWEEMQMNTHLNIDDYGEYETWRLVIPERHPQVIESTYLRALIAVYTRLGGIYQDPMESLEDRYLDNNNVEC